MKRASSFSINGMAKIFGIDRSSMYGWIRRGAPIVPAAGPGRPARMYFGYVLRWRSKFLYPYPFWREQRMTYEREIRERFKVLNKK